MEAGKMMTMALGGHGIRTAVPIMTTTMRLYWTNRAAGGHGQVLTHTEKGFQELALDFDYRVSYKDHPNRTRHLRRKWLTKNMIRHLHAL
jgi:hypothetical protein